MLVGCLTNQHVMFLLGLTAMRILPPRPIPQLSSVSRNPHFKHLYIFYNIPFSFVSPLPPHTPYVQLAPSTCLRTSFIPSHFAFYLRPHPQCISHSTESHPHTPFICTLTLHSSHPHTPLICTLTLHTSHPHTPLICTLTLNSFAPSHSTHHTLTLHSPMPTPSMCSPPMYIPPFVYLFLFVCLSYVCEDIIQVFHLFLSFCRLLGVTISRKR